MFFCMTEALIKWDCLYHKLNIFHLQRWGWEAAEGEYVWMFVCELWGMRAAWEIKWLFPHLIRLWNLMRAWTPANVLNCERWRKNGRETLRLIWPNHLTDNQRDSIMALIKWFASTAYLILLGRDGNVFLSHEQEEKKIRNNLKMCWELCSE